ncbi:MAG: ubiquinone biosynthesis regulatory protein kinase UbiB [Gammaproteobacteria bacterium CG11_big_fil_rev_8_21_14_0_20_46_22]|nr:MAG: ubiquinone biosynthesis regulatory protein kinase UbiB [Gammaproteobacteria bacterium CG12_big_fil_rev_8_21_14_0_65_46_12]PIR10281.1 MAG: ubiquinone biosynthesis regulatory protein kinase UbiB [Gammaproteobacteria bacterium CG11_big_fil_rev_8_21_14_0_20_46_22]
MNSITRFFRIGYIMMRYRVDSVMLAESRHIGLRILRFLNPWFYLPSRHKGPERLRLALETLGPIFVKFGQMLSTRKDIIPAEYAAALAKLQNDVKPFSSELAKKIIKKNLNNTPENLFKKFDDKPLASASIAQVHAATLKTGEKVVVKILRPKVKRQIESDIKLLRLMAALFEKLHPHGKRIRPRDIVEEFSLSLNGELDLNREAANAALIKRNFEGNPNIHIPSIYWDYTCPKVMVMERIEGIPVSDHAALKAQGSDFKRLAELALELFFTQVFRHNFFHADLHPGNIFISTKHVNQYILVDFGIAGSLAEQDRRYIAENMLAFFKRDYHRVAKLHIDAGWVDPHTRVFELEAAIRAVSEPVFQKTLKDISMGQLLVRLFRIAREFNMNIQPQLVLLQKTLLNIEGLGRDLYPELDLWATAKPFLEKWMRDQFGPKAMLKKLKDQLPYIIEKLPELPDLIYHALKEASTAKSKEDPH